MDFLRKWRRPSDFLTDRPPRTVPMAVRSRRGAGRGGGAFHRLEPPRSTNEAHTPRAPMVQPQPDDDVSRPRGHPLPPPASPRRAPPPNRDPARGPTPTPTTPPTATSHTRAPPAPTRSI